MQYVKVLEKRNIDELIIIDIEATKEGRLIDCEKIKEYTSQLFCPLTLGGGIKTLEDINKLLQSGADKVAIRTHWRVIESAAFKFGSQCITAVIDYALITSLCYDSQRNWGNELAILGAGEILLNSMSYEGQMQGYDTESISNIARRVNIPVIVNCGCGSPAHMKQAIEAGASAVAASSMFLFTDITPRDCAEYLKKKGVPVRV